MAQKELIDYINMFREIAERNKLIVFVGSGVSCNVEGMPSWKNLILKMAECVEYTKCGDCKYKAKDCQLTCKFRFDFAPDEYLKIPQYLFNFDEKLYKAILKNAISSNPIDAPMSAAIFNINPKHIITTNYDRLLETSNNFFRNQYEIIIKDADLLSAQKDKYIIKMHGDILNLDTIVLKEDDYLFYSQNHNLIETFVKSLLVDHTILFLGYSLADYNIKLILSWINYMRSQSKVLDSHKIGYIVLDDDNIASIKVSYFENNNIGVININDMPIMPKIPESITDIRGKRLYSFLNCISDYSVLENTFGQWFSVSNIERLLDHEFIESNILLHEIGIHTYQLMDGTLNIYKEDDYNKIDFLLTYDNLKSQRIKSLLINSGIFRVVFSKVFSSQTLQLGSYGDMTIFNDEMYKLYICNNYDEIAATLSKNVTCGMIKQYFYQCIISGYSSFADKYEHIEYGKLNEDEQISFMFNSDFLYSLRTWNFDTHKTEMFINNISFKRKRDLYATYLDILSNDKDMLFLNNQLEKVKALYYHKTVSNVGLSAFYNVVKMRNQVCSRYFFYFYNHIFFKGFTNAHDFFAPYAEAIICANIDLNKKTDSIFREIIDTRKYPIEIIDFDIITKFISTKELIEWIDKYDINSLSADENNVSFFVSCFVNLSMYITTHGDFGFKDSTITILANIALMLHLMPLTPENKQRLTHAYVNLYTSDKFTHKQLSTSCPEKNETLIALSSLVEDIELPSDISIVERIFQIDGFFNYSINVNYRCLRKLILSFMTKVDSIESQSRIKSIIESIESIDKKIIALRFFYKTITDSEIKDYYRHFLSDNFSHIAPIYICEFALSGWLEITQNDINILFEEICKNANVDEDGIALGPDPILGKLDCVYILYICDLIPDISALKCISDGRPHLQFLLDPDNFDYSQVDFSNYMWMNFAGREKYLNKFIENKDSLIPKIKAKIKSGEASEYEKKVYYGFLLDKDEVLEN